MALALPPSTRCPLTILPAQNPQCPKGIIQWQHGSFQKFANGSLILAPIKVDGRQLYSDPCSFKSAIYTRYNTSELFKVRPPPLPSMRNVSHLVNLAPSLSEP